HASAGLERFDGVAAARDRDQRSGGNGQRVPADALDEFHADGRLVEVGDRAVERDDHFDRRRFPFPATAFFFARTFRFGRDRPDLRDPPVGDAAPGQRHRHPLATSRQLLLFGLQLELDDLLRGGGRQGQLAGAGPRFFFARGFFARRVFTRGFFAGRFFARRVFARGFFGRRFFARRFFARGFFARGFFARGFFARGFFARGLL